MTDHLEYWFGVLIILECALSDVQLGAEGGTPPRIFEKKVLVVRAESDHEARMKVVRFAEENAESYQNVNSETVTWRLLDVLDVKQLFDAEIVDGSEVYYSFVDAEEVEQLRASLKPKEGWP